ncbi:MAG: efflux RND transporter permease subunit [Ignavibacteriales bacterium]|nr:efflux RND transporter permease subunit [Ignavibacteriales bacterium]
MNIAKFSVKNSVLVNLLMIGLFIFGWIALNNMPTELNPPVSFNWVFITVTYPGASPVETESLIVDPIESEIKDVDDIDEIQSTAGEGFGFILVKFEDISLTDFRQRYNELKSELDKVSFPEDAEDPIVDDFNSSDFVPLINVNMAFSIPEANAQIIADKIQDELEDLSGVAKVQISGLGEREIWIEVDPEKMNTRNVSFDDVIFALKQRNINVPGGNISIGKTEYLIRSIGEYESVNQIENTIVKTSYSGEFIRLRDIAEVNDTREELTILSRLNGENSISFSVSKNADANSIDVIDAVKNLVEEYRASVPSGVEFSFTNDNSVYINRIIDILRNNAITGMVLIVLILYFFLGKGNAMLASLGIPISFFITFILMDLLGYSLNGNTLFALVMVLGIIVDDAIIVIENCHRYRLLGYSSYDSAILGTREVVSPIISSIGTNIAAFLPLILLPGIMGKFMRIIPIVFSLALLASIFEAFFLLPSHYSDWTKKSKTHKKGEKKFFKVLRNYYTKILVKVLRWRYWVTTALVILMFSSLSIIPLVGVELFGEEDWDVIRVLVQFPEGTSLEETDRIMKKYEQEAFNLSKENVESVITNVGLMQSDEDWFVKKNVAQILMQLKPVEERTKSTDELISELRNNCSYISGAISEQFLKVSGGPPVGKPISIKAQGKYLEEIKSASLVLQDSIKKINGTFDIADNFPPGKKEIRINIDEDKAAMYGFSIQNIALNVRYAFDGVLSTEYRDADDEIDVIVKYNKNYRSSIDDVLNLKISNMAGNTVALRDLVKFDIRTGPTEIRRIDQKRTIFITGDINEDEITLDKVSAEIEKYFTKVEAQFPGVTFSFGGQYDEFTKAFDNILSLFILSMILIFLILGTQFNSYSQPIIILTTVPFALIGAVLGLLISNNPFSIISMFGFVALAGIVVNDAIVLITFINNRRQDEYLSPFQLWRSIVDAGRLRLRPIILTSLTTISGLVPLAFGIGGQSEMWAPLANVILFGLLVSTVLTLFIIPSFAAIIDDLKGSRKKI